jgi:hypothetical protein
LIDVQVHQDGSPVRAAVRARIRALQAGDPLRPVTVAVPSNYAGLALRRALARAEGDDRGGLVNVRFLVLPRVIELLGAPLLAADGQRPLTSLLRGELIRSALQKSPGVFESVVNHPATEERLGETFRELRELSDQAGATLARSGAQVADVVRLFEAVQAEVAGRYYDDTALAVAATQAARSNHPALRDIGALIVHAPGPLTRAEQEFVEALAEVEDVTLLLAAVGDSLADNPTIEQWSAHLTDARPDFAPSIATAVVSAPDADEEVRHALRMVIEQIEGGASLHRIALLSRHTSPYAALVAGQLDAAGIPWNGGNPRTLAQMAPGRTLLGLLDLPLSNFSRASVSAWLGASPVIDANGHTVPAYRWDAVARGAGIVGGRDEWTVRLDRHAVGLRHELGELRGSDDPADWRIRRLERDIVEVDAFRGFMAELFEVLDRDHGGDWPSFAAWATQLLSRYLGSEASLAKRLPAAVDVDREIDTYRTLVSTLESLAGLAEVRPRVDLPTFQRVLRHELDRPARRIGRFGEGVFLGRLVDAAGTDFDHVFVLGMNEGAIPTKGSDDPLVLDSIWDEVASGEGRSVQSRRSRTRSEERRSYLAAMASAPARTLLAPRADLRSQQGRLRSRWLLESAMQLAGHRLTNEDMDRLDEPWYTLIPSFDTALAGQSVAVSLAERDLRSLRAWRDADRALEEHPVALSSKRLRHGWGAQNARRSASFTRWDGRVEVGADELLFTRVQSPSTLERWAKCPRQYLFSTVLHVAEREDPDQVLSISPADRGTLIHAVLERFISEVKLDAPTTGWSDSDRERLLAITAEACDSAEQQGIIGAPLLWQLERKRILSDMEAFPDVDEEYRASFGVVPVATELFIGGDDPVVVDLGDGQTVRLRGFIDRVDRSPDGKTTVVIDYKSGSPFPYKGLDKDPVKAGQALQLPVYALGAISKYGEAGGDVVSRYWFTRRNVEERERFAGYVVGDDVKGIFRNAIGQIVTGIGEGTFVGVPGAVSNGVYEHCRFCPYDKVCGKDRGREFDHKVADPVLMTFRKLSGVEPVAQETE